MRETRQSGSEGGGGDSPDPYHDWRCWLREIRGWSAFADHDGIGAGAPMPAYLSAYGAEPLDLNTK
jgi:hypothetical protein